MKMLCCSAQCRVGAAAAAAAAAAAPQMMNLMKLLNRPYLPRCLFKRFGKVRPH
jgi:hypothetical protein